MNETKEEDIKPTYRLLFIIGWILGFGLFFLTYYIHVESKYDLIMVRDWVLVLLIIVILSTLCYKKTTKISRKEQNESLGSVRQVREVQ